MLAAAKAREAESVPVAVVAFAADAEQEDEDGDDEAAPWFALPSPRVAMSLLFVLLAFGVVLGGVVGPRVSSSDAAAGGQVFVVAASPAPTPTATTTTDTTTTTTTPPPPVTSTAPVPVADVPVTAATTTTTPTTTTPDTQAGGTTKALAPSIKHVWIVMLGDQRYDALYGPESKAPYLSKTLAAKGETLSGYYAIAHESLPNGIAVLSGQGPTEATQQNCPVFSNLDPGTIADDATAQATGKGCVYSAQTYTLLDQLPAQNLTWKAYIESQAPPATTPAPATPAATTTTPTTTAPATTTPTTTTPAITPSVPTQTCRHPQFDETDPWHVPTPGDPYVTWRNPLVYFHTIIDVADTCTKSVVGVDALSKDLAKASTTPNFSYVVPNVCNDGSDTPCAEGAPAGPAAADAWLQKTIPEILASPAYKDSGAIIITTDQAPSTGATADSSTCCGTPNAYPNTTNPGGTATPGAGGGKVGALILSTLVKPGTVVSTPRNHYSLLKAVQDIFGLRYLGYSAAPKVKGFGKEIWTKWDGKS